MTSHKKKLKNISLFILMLFVMFAFSCNFINPKKATLPDWDYSPPSLSQKDKNKLSEYYADRFSNISRAYKEGNTSMFTEATIGLLMKSKQYPIFYLDSIFYELKPYLIEDGLEPHMSFLIDYGFRLQKLKTEKAKQVSEEVIALLKTADIKSFTDVVFIGEFAYQGYSSNIGWAIINLLYSDFGLALKDAYYAAPLDYLSILGDAVNCNTCDNEKLSSASIEIGQLLANDTEITRENIQACEIESGLIAMNLSSRASGNQITDKRSQNFCKSINDIKNGGYSQFNCMLEAFNDYKDASGTSPFGFSQRLESYLECRQTGGYGRRGGSPVKDKMNWYYQGEDDKSKKKKTPEINTSVRNDAEKNGKKGTETIDTEVKDGKVVRETKTFESNDGNLTLRRTKEFDNNGEVAVKETIYDDKETGVFIRDRIDYENNIQSVLTLDSNGVTTKHKDAITGVELTDEEVRERLSRSNNSTPDPTSDYDPCSYMLSDKEINVIKSGGDLGPLINPGPDGSNLDPHLQDLMDRIADCLTLGNASRKTCSNLYRCADQSCECGTNYSIESMNLPLNGLCDRVQCSPNARLNPVTCMCVSYDGTGGIDGITPGLNGPLIGR